MTYSSTLGVEFEIDGGLLHATNSLHSPLNRLHFRVKFPVDYVHLSFVPTSGSYALVRSFSEAVKLSISHNTHDARARARTQLFAKTIRLRERNEG